MVSKPKVLCKSGGYLVKCQSDERVNAISCNLLITLSETVEVTPYNGSMSVQSI